MNLHILRDLIDDLHDVKSMEAKYRAERIEIEEKIADLIPGPERGQRTVSVDHYKVTVERGFNYKADCTAIESVMINPLSPPPIKVKTTRELDIAGYEWYKEQNPDVFAVISQYVTVTPKKISVTIKQ